jgi:hypothetical protein
VSALLVLSYLSLAPHVNGTEDLHLYVVAILLGRLGRDRPDRIARWAPYLAIAALFVASRGSLGNPAWTGAAFAAKLALVALTLAIVRATRMPESGVTVIPAVGEPSRPLPQAASDNIRARAPAR